MRAFRGLRKMCQTGARLDGRSWNQVRPIEFLPGYLKYPLGSCMVRWGDNIIVTAVNVDENLAPFCKANGHGWITAEYRLLPSATVTRNPNIVNARSQEIRRFIGRSLRAAVDLYAIEGKRFTVDCEVIQADGGTRIACVCAGFIALTIAFSELMKMGELSRDPVKYDIAGLSAVLRYDDKLSEHVLLIDPNYMEDSTADIDLNLVFSESGHIVELQLTGEGKPIHYSKLTEYLQSVIEVGQEVMVKVKEALKVSRVQQFRDS